jgi:hypothetical protein
MDLKELEQTQRHSGSGDPLSGEGRLPIGASSADEARLDVEHQRRAAAERIGTLAGAANHAAGDLDAAFPQTARFLRDTAAGFEQISNFLYDPKLDDITDFFGNLRRRQPVAMTTGFILVSLGLFWLLQRSRGNAAVAI